MKMNDGKIRNIYIIHKSKFEYLKNLAKFNKFRHKCLFKFINNVNIFLVLLRLNFKLYYPLKYTVFQINFEPNQ